MNSLRRDGLGRTQNTGIEFRVRCFKVYLEIQRLLSGMDEGCISEVSYYLNGLVKRSDTEEFNDFKI